jgi:hypothetical protein
MTSQKPKRKQRDAEIRYAKSEKGKLSRALCTESGKRKLSEDKYKESKKGKMTRKRYRDRYYKTVKGRINMMFGAARKRSLDKGLEFSIGKDDILIPEKCPLLGFDLVCDNFDARYNSPSPDRKDSRKGYTKDNIWVISTRANILKNDADVKELELLVSNLKLCGFT